MINFKTLFKNKKFVRTFFGVFVILAIAGIFLGIHLSKKGKKINVVKVQKGNVEEYYSTKGIIESVSQNSYVIIDGTKVEKLHVKAGESVKKGDLLAEFDTTGVVDMIKQKEKIYNEALNQYYKVSRSVDAARTQVASLGNKIEILQSAAEEIKDKMGIPANSNANKITADQLKSALDALSGGSSDLSDEEIDKLLNEIKQNNTPIQSEYGIDDINKIISSGSTLENQLLNLDLQIDLLNAQKNTLETSISQTYLDGYKAAVDTSKQLLDEMKAQKKELDEGWIANTTGVVLEVNIKEGEVFHKSKTNEVETQNLLGLLQKLYNSDLDINDLTSQLMKSQATSSDVGMVINNFKDYFVKFDIGKYDTQRIKLGMDVKVDFLSNNYKGSVSYIGTKAADNSTDITSALTGSKSSSSNKLPARVSLKKPDKNLILGFDVTVKIKTREAKNVLTIPIEALMGDSKNSYVYVYNASEKSVEKRKVKVGLSSNDKYEVKSGLKKGEKVVKNLSEELKKDDKFYVGD